jgi:hypothetical protein
MVTLAAVALTSWLCALLAIPRRPLPNNEVQELVYARLLGRQQILMLFAVIATAAAFLALVTAARPDRIDPGFHALRHPNASCVQGTYDPGLCAAPQAGTRVIREVQDDGRAAIVATVVVPTQK